MISTVILAKNEEGNIKECINSLSFCNEIIVIDDYSKDKTGIVSKKLNARVLRRRLNNNYASQRNYGLKKTKNNWVLYIDADERVTKELKEEIIDFIKEYGDKYNGAYIKRKDYMWGREFSAGESGNIRLLRLGKKDKGKWVRKVHEYWNINGKVKTLSNPILHYPHPKLKDFIKDINKYSGLHARSCMDEGKISTLFKIIFYPIGHFLKNFIFHKGFHDGIRGFVFALTMSLHSYLSWSKLWIYQKRK